jgi:hypothetical protein
MMTDLETCLQNSFQMHPDKSESSDHSFKFVDVIFAAIGFGKAFTARHNSMSLAGKANFEGLTHAKSNHEIKPLAQEREEVRQRFRTQTNGG